MDNEFSLEGLTTEVSGEILEERELTVTRKKKEEVSSDEDVIETEKIISKTRESILGIAEIEVPGSVYSEKGAQWIKKSRKENIKEIVRGPFGENGGCDWKFLGSDENAVTGKWICNDKDGVSEIDGVFEKDGLGNTILAKFTLFSEGGKITERISRIINLLAEQHQAKVRLLGKAGEVRRDYNVFVNTDNFSPDVVEAFHNIKSRVDDRLDDEKLLELVNTYRNRIARKDGIAKEMFSFELKNKYGLSPEDTNAFLEESGKIIWQG